MEQKLTTKEEYLKRINVIVEYINNHLDEDIDVYKRQLQWTFNPGIP